MSGLTVWALELGWDIYPTGMIDKLHGAGSGCAGRLRAAIDHEGAADYGPQVNAVVRARGLVLQPDHSGVETDVDSRWSVALRNIAPPSGGCMNEMEIALSRLRDAIAQSKHYRICVEGPYLLLKVLTFAQLKTLSNSIHSKSNVWEDGGDDRGA